MSPIKLRKIVIAPATTSVSISSGQRVTVNFELVRVNDDSAVSLSVGPLPPGITAALSPQSLPSSPASQPFSLTLTAAPDVAPAETTIEVIGPSRASVSINAKASGTVRPSYQLLTVVYAPPGTNGGKGSSMVEYGSGSTTGTKNSTSNSFKAGVDVSVSLGIDIGKIVNLDASGDFTASQTTGDTSSVSINKGTNYKIDVKGPAKDGINHGDDLFYLWLNPLLNVTIDSQNNVTWGIGVDGQTMLIQYVYVSWLQNPSTMPPGVAQALADAGLTTADYAQILACNPFSSGNTAIDPNRFVPTASSFPYEPPPTANDPVPTTTYTQTSSTTVENEQQVQNQYGVSASVEAGFSFIYKDKVKVTGSLQWTNTSTSTQITGSSQSASVTVGGPAFGYTGPTDVLVYWDTLYNSFMFVFATETPAASGTLTDSAGNPIPNKALTLTTGGRTLSTFTDSRGQYRFYGAAQGQGTISVDNEEFAVAVGPGEASTVLHVTA
jgi:hypothetical protein